MKLYSFDADIGFETWRIGDIIKDLRCKRGMSRADLAERVNVDEKTVARWERGEIDFGNVCCRTLVALAKLFEVDVKTILALQG